MTREPVKTVGQLTLATRGDTEIVIQRSFAAPRQLVFDCHSRPELVRRWLLGPPGWTMRVCEIDFRIGGRYRYLWRGPDGAEMGMGGEFRDIVAPERIVTRERFDQDWTGGDTEGTLLLAEAGAGTLMTLTVRYSSAQARAGALATPMAEGMEAGYARLDALARADGTGAAP
jgi:uncharacterized protein YndB with AHSA1/START domain